MKPRARISESDYHAIMQWENEGGKPADISYRIVSDSGWTPKHTIGEYSKSVEESNGRTSNRETEPAPSSK